MSHVFTANICTYCENTNSYGEGSFFIKRKSLDVRKVEKAKVLFLHEETMQPLTT